MEPLRKRWVVRVKGRRDPIEVSDVMAKALKIEWNRARDERALTRTVEIDGAMLTFDRVVSIEPMSARDLSENDDDATRNAKREENAKVMSQIAEEYAVKRRERLAKAPLERGMALGIAEMVWWAYTGKQGLPENLIDDVQARQANWFEQFPKLTYANPTCYRDLLEPHRVNPKTPTEAAARDAALRIVERAIAKDMSYAAGR